MYFLLNPIGFAFLIAGALMPVLAQSEANEPHLLSPSEAEAMVKAERLERESQQQASRAALLAVPAIEEKALQTSDGRIIYRRITAEKLSPQEAPDAGTGSETTLPADAEAILDVEAHPNESISLAGKVYDDFYSEITWRDQETQEQYTVWTNLNLTYLQLIGSFDDGEVRYGYFGLIDCYRYEDELARIEAAQTLGTSYESHWKEPPVHLSQEDYEYVVLADDTAVVPEKLYRQLDALFHYYLAHREELEIQHRNSLLLQAAREKDLKENPPAATKEYIINFTHSPASKSQQ